MFKGIVDYFVRTGQDLNTAKLIAAQSAHETGNFSSRILRENNNLFGMKVAKIRPTTAISENLGHAVYKNLEDSLKDYTYYQAYVGYPKVFEDPETFVSFLKERRYFEADPAQYLRGIKHFLQKYGL